MCPGPVQSSTMKRAGMRPRSCGSAHNTNDILYCLANQRECAACRLCAWLCGALSVVSPSHTMLPLQTQVMQPPRPLHPQRHHQRRLQGRHRRSRDISGIHSQAECFHSCSELIPPDVSVSGCPCRGTSGALEIAASAVCEAAHERVGIEHADCEGLHFHGEAERARPGCGSQLDLRETVS